MKRKPRITRAGISDGQRTAARLMALHENWSKDRIAEAAGVSRTTLYGWLRDSRFQSLVEEYLSTPQHSLWDTDDIVSRLDGPAKEELLLRLQAIEAAQPDMMSEIGQQVDRLRRRLDAAPTERRGIIESEIERLIGRLELMHDPNAPFHYESDGSSKPPTAESFFVIAEDIEELAILDRVIRGTDLDEAMLPAIYGYAVAAGLRAGISVSTLYGVEER